MPRIFLRAGFIVLFSISLYAQKGHRNRHLEILPQFNQASAVSVKEYPSSLRNLAFSSKASTAEKIAWHFLEEQGYRLGITDISTLQHKKTRYMPSGYRVRFRQVYKGYPVYKSGVVISINSRNEVVFVANGYKPNVKNNQKIITGEDKALQIAKEHLVITSDLNYLNSDIVIFYQKGISRLARKINFIPQTKNVGDWEFLIDAETAQIIQAKDLGFYQQGTTQLGRGMVYDPDPITRADTDYGTGGFVNNNDQDTPQLTEQRIERELSHLTFEGGNYYLKNEYASIIDPELPQTGLHAQDSAHFYFTRSQEAFEAVNIYYHINQSMSYINDTLGIALMPYQYQGGVHFDPHGLEGEDNSWYISSAGYVAFGDGGVGDAEDQDVIIHELGHGIHDWITDGELSQVEGLSEGCGDYWAQSYKRAKGFLNAAHPKYNWLFSWDGHNSFWPGRQTDYDAKYPEDLIDQIHTDGQIWATALMKIHDIIGRQVTDNNFLSAISMLNANSSQRDAAYAFIQADIDNYEGLHLQQISDVFYDTGYLENKFSISVTADVTGGPADLRVNFSDIFDSHTSWQWDFNGDGITNSQEKSPSYTYTEPGLYTVKLTVFDGTETISDSLLDFISVNSGVFVWEGLKDGRDNSGRFIYDFLNTHNVPVVYSRSRKLPTSLVGYDAVFLCFGAGKNSVILDEDMLSSVHTYVQTGGRLYIEGADFASTYADNDQFLNLLGLSVVLDGTPSGASISNLEGQPGSIFSELRFTKSEQVEANSIDKYVVNNNGTVAFIESDYGNVAVQGQGSNGQRTVIFSYALAEIVDGRIPSTREDILINILDYMGINLPQAARFSADRNSGHKPFRVNFLNYSIFNKADPEIEWYWDFDNDGIYDSDQEEPTYIFEDTGLYDVKLTLYNNQDSLTTIIPEFIQVFDGESALLFDKDENNIQFEARPELNLTDQYTIEFWMHPRDWGNASEGFGHVFDKEKIQLFLRKTPNAYFNANSLVIFMIHEGSRISSYCTADSSIRLNEWQHIALSYNGFTSTLDGYINGQPVILDTVTIAAHGPVSDNEDIHLVLAESLLGSHSYSGKLDEIRLWNIARSSFQVQTHWNRYVEPDQDGLIAYWKFNEAYGDTLNDLTSNGVNGIILNPLWVEGKPDLLATPIQKNSVPEVVDYKLYENFPNPFNPQTMLKFQIADKAFVNLTIYDVLGRKVKTLLKSELKQGIHSYKWNGENDLNQQVSSGIYFYVLKIKTVNGLVFYDQKKMILIH